MLSLLRGSTPPIDTRAHPRALAALEPVMVNGTRQWVLIRSEDAAANPLVVFVHGGPGTSQLGLMRRCTRALEARFTVVNWDQRLAGKSFSAGHDRTGLHIAQYVDDIVDLTTTLLRRFDKRRLLLVGHSWGSAIGMMAVARRPDLFAGYVGIGQMSRHLESETLSYAWTLEQARQAGDRRAVATLTALGAPPWDSRSKLIAQRRLLGKYGGELHGSRLGALGIVLENLVLASEYTLADRLAFFRGIFASIDALMPELYGVDLFVQVPEVAVPVWFCLGRYDQEVPSSLSARYFEHLRAPRKQLVWFERSAHMPNTEERDVFNRFMLDAVRPTLDA